MNKKKIIYFYIFNCFLIGKTEREEKKEEAFKKDLDTINQQIIDNKSGIITNIKDLVLVDIIKGGWHKLTHLFKKSPIEPSSMSRNIGNMEDSLLKFANFKNERPIPNFWGEVIEGSLIEVMSKVFFDIANEFLDNLGLTIDQNEIAKEIHEKNLIKKNLTLSEEESQQFSDIIGLLNLSTGRNNNNSVIYINGPAGIGKTSNIINELGKNKFTIFYINSSNILYGKYSSNNISNILSGIWKRALKLKNKGQKVVIIFDECESLIKKRNKKKVEEKSIENIIINSRTDLEQALTVFFLYILAQKQVSVVLISNPCFDEEGNLDISEEMNRRINYIYDMQLPSLKNLIKLWRFYLLSYNIKVVDEELENIIYYLSQMSVKKKISIRTISSITSALRGRSIGLKELISLIK